MKIVDTKIENKDYLNEYLEISTCDALLYNSKGLEIYMSKMNTDNIEQKMDELKIKGGIGNETIAVIDKDKELSVTLTEQVVRRELQMAKLQTSIQNGETLATQFPEVYTVNAAKKITLKTKPEYKNEEIMIYRNDTKALVPTSEWTLDETTGTEITFTDLPVDTIVTVSSYQYKLTNADFAVIGKDPNPQVVSLVMNKPLFKGSVICAYKQYFFPNCKLNSSVKFSGKSEKAESPETTELTIMYSEKYGFTGKILWIPIEEEA